MIPGKYSTGRIARELKFSLSTMDRLKAKTKDDQSKLYQVMSDNGVSYAVDPKGKVQKSYFIKE